MKSAYELAMERLEKTAPVQKLTAAQKAEIAELENVCRAKVAEREVFLQGEIAKASTQGDVDALDSLRKQLAVETSRLRADLEDAKARLRG